MATFVLVTGAWHGSWCWKRVRESLWRAGHTVFTPTFTGIGERSHLLSREVDLETHIADVTNLIRWEELNDVAQNGSIDDILALGAKQPQLREAAYERAFLKAAMDGDPDRARKIVAETPEGPARASMLNIS